MKTALRLVLASLLLMPAAGLTAEVIEQVLVKVNGDIITKTELEQRQITALRQKMNGQIDPELLKDDARLKQALSEVTPALIVDAIDELLLLQMGREKGYKLSDEQFKGWLSKLREEQGLQDDAKFQAALKQEGMTIDDLRKNVERQFLISQVQRDEVGQKLQITEEEARQHYLGHAQEFAEPASVTVREILIEVPTTKNAQGQASVNVAREDEAKEKATQVRGRLKAGEDFGKVAAEVSDSSSKANGGLIGPLPMAQLSTTLQQMFDRIQTGEAKELPVVVKADAHGSVEAIVGSIEKLATDEVKVLVLHTGVGAVNESDVTLARASKALIIGFNVRANPQARELARRDGIDIRYYSIIYDLTDDLKKALSGLMAPQLKENILGYAEIREVFTISKVGKVAGCMVTEGLVRRGARVRLLRDNVVVHDGELSQLKRFKDDAREVKEGFECGMTFASTQDIRKGDRVECFEVERIARSL